MLQAILGSLQKLSAGGAWVETGGAGENFSRLKGGPVTIFGWSRGGPVKYFLPDKMGNMN